MTNKKSLERKLRDAKEVIKQHQTAQWMLMEQVINYVDRGDYHNLRKFAENYRK